MWGNFPDTSAITTAVLAGGAASRLGGLDKGLYPLKNRPLIEWVIKEIKRESAGPILIVANRNISRYSQYAETISDTLPGHAGPLAGVFAALSACRTSWLFTVPVDCVRPPPGLMSSLSTVACQQGAEAVVACDTRRRQPLFGLYSKKLLASCVDGVSQAWGVSRWQDSLGILEVEVAIPQEDWINLNSAAEFAAYEEALDD